MQQTSTYREEGWSYDLIQIRAAIVMLVVAVASFGALLIDFRARFGSHEVGCTAGLNVSACSGASDALAAFLFSLLAGVTSLVAVGVGAYLALTNTHRVGKLAWTCAGLGASLLIALVVFLVALSF